MKVYCIDDEGVHLSVTSGKWYEVVKVLKSDSHYTLGYPSSDINLVYWIVNDYGQKRGIEKSKFLTIEEFREKKLKILGI
jgi:hypothetical protein